MLILMHTLLRTQEEDACAARTIAAHTVQCSFSKRVFDFLFFSIKAALLHNARSHMASMGKIWQDLTQGRRYYGTAFIADLCTHNERKAGDAESS